MTPETIEYLQKLGGYAAVLEGFIIIWLVSQWLKALAAQQKWQEGCKLCLTTRLNEQIEQTKSQVIVTQQNSAILQKFSQDLAVVRKVLALLEGMMQRPPTAKRSK